MGRELYANNKKRSLLKKSTIFDLTNELGRYKTSYKPKRTERFRVSLNLLTYILIEQLTRIVRFETAVLLESHISLFSNENGGGEASLSSPENENELLDIQGQSEQEKSGEESDDNNTS